MLSPSIPLSPLNALFPSESKPRNRISLFSPRITVRGANYCAIGETRGSLKQSRGEGEEREEKETGETSSN